MHAFYNHWATTLDDSLVANTEDPSFKSGSLPDTVPDITKGYNSDASWSSVWPSTLHTLWSVYGDATPVAKFWPDVMAYVNHTFAGIDPAGDVFHQFGKRRGPRAAHSPAFPPALLPYAPYIPLPFPQATGARPPTPSAAARAPSRRRPSPRRRPSSTI